MRNEFNEQTSKRAKCHLVNLAYWSFNYCGKWLVATLCGMLGAALVQVVGITARNDAER